VPLQEVHTGFTFNFDGSKLSAIQRGVGRASTNLNTIAAKTEVFSQKIGGFFQRAKGVIGAYLGFRAVRAITMDYAKGADAIAKFSAGLGISAQRYQALTHAAQLNGLSIEELNVALPNLAKNAGNAADGSKSMADAFRRAGVEFKAGKALGDPIDLLQAFADGLKEVDDPIRRTQILMNTFGRSGKKMGVLMAQGSEGIKKAMVEAEKLGLVLSERQLKDAERFNDEMLRVKAVLTGVRNTIASRVVPALSNALEKFHKWWVEGRNAERALRALKLVAIFTGIVIARLIGAGVVRQVKLFVQGIWAGVQALRAMGVAGAATALKIWAIVAAFAIVALAIEDLIGFAQGKDSVIGRILGPSKLATDLKKALLDIGKAAVKAWREMKPALLDAWEALKPSLRELGGLLKPLAGPVFKLAIMSLISALHILNFSIQQVTTTIKVLRSAGNAVSSALKGAAEIVTVAWEDVSDTITDGLNDAKALAKTVAAALGIDLGGAAKKVGEAWDLGLKGIRKGLDLLNIGLSKALKLKGLLFGVDIGTLNLEKRTRQIRESLEVVAGPTGEAVLPGLFQPRGVTAFRGAGAPAPAPARAFGLGAAVGGLGQRIANVSVAAGAVQVTTSATGDPEQIAAAQNVAIIRGLNKVITDASRDLVKPPRGQR
jgi:hypothetical protein